MNLLPHSSLEIFCRSYMYLCFNCVWCENILANFYVNFIEKRCQISFQFARKGYRILHVLLIFGHTWVHVLMIKMDSRIRKMIFEWNYQFNLVCVYYIRIVASNNFHNFTETQIIYYFRITRQNKLSCLKL